MWKQDGIRLGGLNGWEKAMGAERKGKDEGACNMYSNMPGVGFLVLGGA